MLRLRRKSESYRATLRRCVNTWAGKSYKLFKDFVLWDPELSTIVFTGDVQGQALEFAKRALTAS